MKRFLLFFVVYYLVEMTISLLVGFLVVLFHSFPDVGQAIGAVGGIFFIHFNQILIRNVLGNYCFSWIFMRYATQKKWSYFGVAILNSVSVFCVFSILVIVFGAVSRFDELVLEVDYIFIPMAIGVIFSSLCMARISKSREWFFGDKNK